MNARYREARFPLHITISSLFITLVVILGSLLSWQNYSKTSAIILSSAERLYEQLAQEMILDFRVTYYPIADALSLMALSPVIDADTLQQRLASLKMFSTALRNRPSLSAIQVGYANGDYFIVRPMRSAAVRERFSAPDLAQYVVDNVYTEKSGERRLLRIFFDGALGEISRNVPIATDYDPRQRPWYQGAGDQPAASTPYLFYFSGKVGTTVALKAAPPGVVIAADVTLEQLSDTISRHQITPSSEVLLIDAGGQVLAHNDIRGSGGHSEAADMRLAQLSELDSEVLTYLSRDLEVRAQSLDFTFRGQRWKGAIKKIASVGGVDLNVLMISPLDELLSEAIAIRWESLMTTFLIILITIPVVWYVSTRISGSLQRLAAEAGLIRHFDFSSPVRTRSFITEVSSLADAMAMMKTTISRFLTLINSLAGERDFDSLLQRVTRETQAVSGADGVLTYLVDESEQYLEPGNLYESEKGDRGTERLPRLPMSGQHRIVASLDKKEPCFVHLDRQQADALQPLLEELNARSLTIIPLPLRNRRDETIGTLCLLYRDRRVNLEDGKHNEHIAFVQALSGFAAVTLEGRHMLMMQEALLDAFIKLIAGAIDAKSPYTGGHCQRVPELTRMLAQAACDSDDPPFRDFKLEPEQWDALDIASWLHDCGKVTTPEYVVDKATKLETLYDRIHEVRMRFEILKRDAEIRYWEQLAAGGDRTVLGKALQDECRQLDEEFAFVAECNQGGEFMAPEKVERLRCIAARTWMRTLDDRVGISWEEQRRKEREPPRPLPVEEKLLDNKVEHLVERNQAERMSPDNPWGFRLDVPGYKYNRGEIYNLEVSRGTLTPEERYQINEHIVQTIIMLEKLPYPKHLREVPLLAGCHHETMDGNGYPKRLTREQMPLPARMMAIADIFEALTASDRPYKKAKTLSEAIRILAFMKNDQHIDPDLFELFLTSGTWLKYGRKYLQAEQIDEVDVSEYLHSSKGN